MRGFPRVQRGINLYYRIADVTLYSGMALPSFAAFECEPGRPDVTLERTGESVPDGADSISGELIHRRLPDGWYFRATYGGRDGLIVSSDYTRLCFAHEDDSFVSKTEEWFVRIALECYLAYRGYVSLHAACVELDGKAYAFSAPSGIGKSTRAEAWMNGLGAKLVSGDRPLIRADGSEVLGIPWDGKEQCFRNVRYPLQAICEIRRSDTNYIRRMSFEQRRKMLMQQCFIAMWDIETAAVQMSNIARLAADAEVVRMFCGPGTEDARGIVKRLDRKEFLKEEKDMKAKEGFVLREIAGEHLLMPVGDNIGKFSGTILLNRVSAFVWEQLQAPVSRDDLLQAILDRFEVDEKVAAADLDALLEKLTGFGIIEED